ncbi:MAG: hypothetical protein R2705_09265 [Ilumatobacteraceae bacterium]
MGLGLGQRAGFGIGRYDPSDRFQATSSAGSNSAASRVTVASEAQPWPG